MKQEKHLGTEIYKVSHCMKRTFDKLFEKYELTGVQVRLLGYICRRSKEQDIFQRDIEEAFNIRRSSVTSIIQLLEKRGFIERVKVSHDARLNKILLTAKTVELHEKIFQEVGQVEEMLLEDFTEEELEIFFDMLSRMSQKLDTISKKEEVV